MRAHDAVGFDVDHTLIRYTRRLQELVFSALATFFVKERGYPEAIAAFEYSHDFWCVAAVDAGTVAHTDPIAGGHPWLSA